MPLITLEYVRPGKGTTTYVERLVLDRPDVKVLVMEAAPADVAAGGAIIQQRGAPIVWFVFPGQWHDIGRFYLADGTFTGWYTNLCTPVSVNGNRIAVTDLFLDLWMPVSGGASWLDEDEFEHAVQCEMLPDDLIAGARAERSRIDSLVARRAWPPETCRDWT